MRSSGEHKESEDGCFVTMISSTKRDRERERERERKHLKATLFPVMSLLLALVEGRIS
jgi:hypothetical protein